MFISTSGFLKDSASKVEFRLMALLRQLACESSLIVGLSVSRQNVMDRSLTYCDRRSLDLCAVAFFCCAESCLLPFVLRFSLLQLNK